MGHHIGRLVGASHEAFNKSHIKTPHTPSSLYIFLPLIHLLRHTCMNMEAVKGFLTPLGLNTNSIQDTLVCLFRSFPVLKVKVLSYVSQKLVVIGGTVETARRASISAWNGFVDCSYLISRTIWLAKA